LPLVFNGPLIYTDIESKGIWVRDLKNPLFRRCDMHRIRLKKNVGAQWRRVFYSRPTDISVGDPWLCNSAHAQKPGVIPKYDFSIPDRHLRRFLVNKNRELRNEKIITYNMCLLWPDANKQRIGRYGMRHSFGVSYISQSWELQNVENGLRKYSRCRQWLEYGIMYVMRCPTGDDSTHNTW